MSDEETFDVRDLIRTVADRTEETDPRRIAGMVLAEIDEDDYEAALLAVLPSVVTQVLGQMRMRMRRPTHSVQLHEKPSAPVPVRPLARDRDGHPVASRRVAAIREAAWKRRLRENIWVGADESARKFLGNCTVVDLDRAIELSETIAAKNLAVADERRRLRKALLEHSVATVVELPEDVLAEILDREEAAA